MTVKPVELPERARHDLDEAVELYLTQAGTSVALAFIDALERSFCHVEERPVCGTRLDCLERLQSPRPQCAVSASDRRMRQECRRAANGLQSTDSRTSRFTDSSFSLRGMAQAV